MSGEKMQALARVKRDVDFRLNQLFDDLVKQAGKIDQSHKRLLADISKQVCLGDKRLEPYFCWLGYKAAGGNDEELVGQLGLAVELYHNFLLMHEDVLDRNDRRFGKLNIIGLAKKRFHKKSRQDMDGFASGTGVLAGDIMHGLAITVVSDLKIDDKTRSRLLAGFEKLTQQAVAGLHMELILKLQSEVELKKILKVYQTKTAPISVASLEFGATLAGANDRIISILRQYGTAIGIASQVQYDILAMFASAKSVGRPILSDLRQGKKTALMYYGLRFSNAVDRKILLAKSGDLGATSADLKLVRKILSDSGAKAKTIFLAKKYSEVAKKALDKVEFIGDVKEQLKQTADFLVNHSN